MSKELLAALLDSKFYSRMKSIDALPKDEFFSSEIRPLYRTIKQVREATPEVELSPFSLYDLHLSYHPTLTPPAKELFKELCEGLVSYDTVLADDILTRYRRQELIREAVDSLLSIEGTSLPEDVITSLRGTLESLEKISGFEDETDEEESVTLDNLEDILVGGEVTHKWKWNYQPVQQATNGLPESAFMIVAARPNAGKTAFYLSSVCNDGGFLEQGANVAVWRNEERYQLVAQRAVSCFLGVPFEDAVFHVDKYKEKRDKTKGNIFILKDSLTNDASLSDIDKYLYDNPHIDILIIDQLDNVMYDGKYVEGDTQLMGLLYRETRAMSIRHNVAIIAVTQAGGEAEGKAYPGMNALYGSKTNKQGSVDTIFVIGSFPVVSGEADDGQRVVNFVKNKFKGPARPVLYKLNHKLSRIEQA